jgi:hypothetical protein
MGSYVSPDGRRIVKTGLERSSDTEAQGAVWPGFQQPED